MSTKSKRMSSHNVYDLIYKGEKREYPFYLFGSSKKKVSTYLVPSVRTDIRKKKAKLVRVYD